MTSTRLRLPLFVALVASHLLVFVVPVVVLIGAALVAGGLDRARHEGLARQADLAALLVAGHGAGPELDALVQELATRTHAGVRVVDAEGRVVASNGPRLGDDLHDRPEIAAALGGAEGLAVRRDPPLAAGRHHRVLERASRVTQDPWLFVASPVREGETVTGAVVLARSSRHDVAEFTLYLASLGWGAPVAFGSVLLLVFYFSWRLSRSLHGLAVGVGPYAEGRGDDLPGARSRLREVGGLAEAFTRVVGRLRTQLERNRDFAANVAHEFKTPLTTLRGTVDLLLDDDDPLPAEQRRRFLENARTDVGRLERMVSGLLELARAEAAHPDGDVDLDALLADAGPPVRGVAGHVRGDARLLATALRNLVENARTHGAEPIVLEAFPGGFRVVDAGPGISSANLPKVFDRFFTTGRDRAGTGLGLALVRAIVQAHGGDVRIESEPGRTVVAVELPA